MNRFLPSTARTLAGLACVIALSSSPVRGDVILTFDQNGISNGVPIDQSYGDNVTQSPDVNGHQYAIIGATTPNIDVIYFPLGEGRLWTTGYGDLDNVLYKSGRNGVLDVILEDLGNPNSEIYLKSFDLAAFQTDKSLTNVQVLGASDSVLWSGGSTLVPGTGRRTFNFVNENGFGLNGISSANRLVIKLDFNGMGDDTDDIGIDNIRFAQTAITASPVPEPGSGALFLLASMGLCRFRRRK